MTKAANIIAYDAEERSASRISVRDEICFRMREEEMIGQSPKVQAAIQQVDRSPERGQPRCGLDHYGQGAKWHTHHHGANSGNVGGVLRGGDSRQLHTGQLSRPWPLHDYRAGRQGCWRLHGVDRCAIDAICVDQHPTYYNAAGSLQGSHDQLDGRHSRYTGNCHRRERYTGVLVRGVG
jgi:hypothetical protein